MSEAGQMQEGQSPLHIVHGHGAVENHFQALLNPVSDTAAGIISWGCCQSSDLLLSTPM